MDIKRFILILMVHVNSQWGTAINPVHRGRLVKSFPRPGWIDSASMAPDSPDLSNQNIYPHGHFMGMNLWIHPIKMESEWSEFNNHAESEEK